MTENLLDPFLMPVINPRNSHQKPLPKVVTHLTKNLAQMRAKSLLTPLAIQT
jgi:hypothetical protein